MQLLRWLGIYITKYGRGYLVCLSHSIWYVGPKESSPMVQARRQYDAIDRFLGLSGE